MSRRVANAICVAVLVVAGTAAGLFGGIAWENHRAEARSHEPSPVDIGFAQDMGVHHDQAILIVHTLPSDVSPSIRRLADRIAATQAAEAATMRGWLDWFALPVTSDTPMAWMHPGDHDHRQASPTGDEPPMPGMADADDLAALGEAHRTAAEVLFLQLMVRHHQGGIEMAQAAYNSGTASRAIKHLSLAMISEQGDEIGEMTLLLRARDAQPLAPR